MKSSRILALALAMAAAPLCASAVEPENHDAHHPAASAPEQAPAKAAVPSMKMDAHMQAMHEKMMKAKTPEERAALMAENMQHMQECMSMMNEMAPAAAGAAK